MGVGVGEGVGGVLSVLVFVLFTYRTTHELTLLCFLSHTP